MLTDTVHFISFHHKALIGRQKADMNYVCFCGTVLTSHECLTCVVDTMALDLIYLKLDVTWLKG